MPWKETEAVKERMRFVVRLGEGERMAALCREFEISPKTGYKIYGRWCREGMAGLGDRSRAPHSHPAQVGALMAALVVGWRELHPTWGPKKLRAHLQRYCEGVPAASTIGALLRRQGLNVPRQGRHHVPPHSQPLAHAQGPNTVWCADFKGWFRTRNGQICYPLTVTDGYSRFLIRCQALVHPSYQETWPVLEAAFREYGLPAALRTDNGTPFAGQGLGGLCRLAIRLLKLGVLPERIARGRPEQNGRHERMHRTLKAEATQPPQANLRLQQLEFQRFQQEFNFQRPHEALHQQVPADHYHPSPRPYPQQEPQLEYGPEFVVRQVRHSGEIRWAAGRIYLTQALAGEPVGLLQVDDHHWSIYFGRLELAQLDSRRMKLVRPRLKRRHLLA
jgi:transposase InsO family protein